MDQELSELTGVLNQMMDRLEHSFQHANRFSADVSHELKTYQKIFFFSEINHLSPKTSKNEPGNLCFFV